MSEAVVVVIVCGTLTLYRRAGLDWAGLDYWTTGLLMGRWTGERIALSVISG